MPITYKKVLRSKTGDIISKIQYKIRLDVENSSQRLLGIDLLKSNVKKDLLIVVAGTLENKLVQIINSRFQKNKITEPVNSKKEFLELVKYSAKGFLLNHYGVHLNITEKSIENSLCIQSIAEDFDILYKIPLQAILEPQSTSFRDLFSPIYNSASEDFVEALFDNLILEISNCVLYLIAIDFSYLSNLQKTIYKSNFLSLRNMERFRNNLTWQLKTKMNLMNR